MGQAEEEKRLRNEIARVEAEIAMRMAATGQVKIPKKPTTQPAWIFSRRQTQSDPAYVITRADPDGASQPQRLPVRSARGTLTWAITILLLGSVVLLWIGSTLSHRQAAPAGRAIAGVVTAQAASKDGMRLVFVPSGSFRMGSDKSFDAQAQDNELPQHTINLSDYWIDQTEVTNAMYARCVAAGGCTAPRRSSSATHSDYFGSRQYAQFPVSWVSWSQASAYCQWAGRRLPSEAEWEKAARGPDGRTFPWGSQAPSCSLANFWSKEDGCVGDAVQVGSYPAGASPYGVLDMAGSVFEWTADWYSTRYYANSPLNDPPGPASGDAHVLRGGSWGSGPRTVRAAVRLQSTPNGELDDVGFRCALSAGK
jgi:formylglycine-generating enzyme required for sulfatase activity